jgi:vitamin B12 transporter
MARRFARIVLVPVFLAGVVPALSQSPPAPAPGTLDASVVVSGDAIPEPLETLGAAATVIGAREASRAQQTNLLEMMRTVPGLDVVQSGGPGTVTSLFLRGTNSTQTLVLVDGVKLNSAYFGGVDLSAVGMTNVERVEVVRGPFSALWGSEAVGGVVQVFTKRAAGGIEDGVTARGRFAGGSAGALEGDAEVGVREGRITASAGFRRSLVNGDSPNEFFAVTNVSGAFDVAFSDAVKAGVVVRHDEGHTGIPRDSGVPTPYRSTRNETTTVAVPLVFHLGSTLVEASGRWEREHPTFSDPGDPFGFTSSETTGERMGGRLVVTQPLGVARLSVGTDWERTLVSSESSYGVALDRAATRTWSVFAEGRVALAGEKLVATGGLRYDDHSAFGGFTSPRVALAFRPLEGLKLRAAVGRAFRAPSTGDLYYPFYGNPNLKPETAWAYEAGAEVAVTPGVVAEASLFRNDIADLIDSDPVTFLAANIRRARTRGVETVLRTVSEKGLFARASYTYLEAVDLDSGAALLRRPRHRASATVGAGSPSAGSFSVTALFVGPRPDRDAANFSNVVESPSYVRFDAAATSPQLILPVALYARLTNLLGRRYSEVNGFPAPGRRFLIGLEVSF